VIRRNDHLTGKALPGAGAVHHIKSRREQLQQILDYSIAAAARCR
jgi:hypothetical protein